MNPITDSHVPSILQKQSYHKVTHITLSCVLQGQLALREQLVQQIEEGSRIIVIDAISNEDIDVIAEAMMTIKDFDVMPVDPGPLTAAYGYAKTAQSVKNNKIIVTVGSITSLTGCQLQYVIDKRNANQFTSILNNLPPFHLAGTRKLHVLQRKHSKSYLVKMY